MKNEAIENVSRISEGARKGGACQMNKWENGLVVYLS